MFNLIGLYIHIPFCKSKCPYCDFYSSRGTENEYTRYTAIIEKKIEMWSKKINKHVATIYFGGGTPSILGAEKLCRILDAVKKNFYVADDAEITVEVNPDSGKKIDFEKMRKCGFNRISVGMQSAVGSELKSLGRIHTAEEARLTVNQARSMGFNNISLDLMMGIPNQTIQSLKKSIEFCKSCEVNHISSYILKIEENTHFHRMKDKLLLPDDDYQAELYLKGVELLESLGYKQYEISNFAKPGFESRHNINYWKCGEYIGIGPSAHSFYEGKRFFYSRSMKDFENDVIIFDCEGGSEEEFIMLSLRLKNGLIFNEFNERFGHPIPHAFIKKAEFFKKAGFMEIDDNKIFFTPKGYLVSNTIISELI